MSGSGSMEPPKKGNMSSSSPPPPPQAQAEGGGGSSNQEAPSMQQQQQEVAAVASSSNDAAISDAAASLRPYVYRDFAQDDTDYGGDAGAYDSTTAAGTTTTTTGGGDVGVRGLTNQKLPAKLNAMLSDPDLVTCITWMPHGRSWKILNRDVFSRYALPKYFGHTNHASFIRIVNAWGFRRVVTSGPDRDTYYHELFLRGKHNLHVKMKRLPTTHRKTPMDKNESSPNFYEMSEKSPLPENVWLPQAGVVSHRGGGAGATGMGGPMGMMEGYGMMGSAAAAAAGMGGGMMSGMNSRMQYQQQQQQQQQQHHMMGHPMSGMMPGIGMMSAPFGYPSVNPAAASATAAAGGMGSVGPAAGTSPSASAAAAGAASMSSTTGVHPLSDNETLLQLQRENDTLMRQLLQLQSQMIPPNNPNNTNNAEEGSSAAAAAAITALQRDNERLIRQVMELQEQLPQELRMQIPMEMLMPQNPSRPQQQPQPQQQQLQEEQKKKGKSEEKERVEI